MYVHTMYIHLRLQVSPEGEIHCGQVRRVWGPGTNLHAQEISRGPKRWRGHSRVAIQKVTWEPLSVDPLTQRTTFLSTRRSFPDGPASIFQDCSPDLIHRGHDTVLLKRGVLLWWALTLRLNVYDQRKYDLSEPQVLTGVPVGRCIPLLNPGAVLYYLAYCMATDCV